MKTLLSRWWAGMALVAVAASLAAQEEAKPPVLDWLYVDAGPVVVAQDPPENPPRKAWHGLSAEAVIEFVVNAQGAVEQVKVAGATDPAVGEAAASAVARWKFTPALQGGQPVSTRLQAPFLFESGRKPRLLIALESFGPYAGQIVRDKEASPPELRFQARPVYPSELRAQGANGSAVLSFVVTETGQVANVRLVSATNPAFAVSASNALMRWRFKPAKLHGHAVAVPLRVPFEFSVNDSGK